MLQFARWLAEHNWGQRLALPQASSAIRDNESPERTRNHVPLHPVGGGVGGGGLGSGGGGQGGGQVGGGDTGAGAGAG